MPINLPNQNTSSHETLANFISTVSNPPFVAIPVFLIINYTLLYGGDWLWFSAISIFFVSILPIITSSLWIKKKNLEVDMPRRQDRIYPLLLVIASYITGVAVLYILGAPPLTTVLMICYLNNTIIVLLFSLYWKISIHAMGIAGPATAIIYLFGWYGVLFSLLVPLVLWSRLYLKRHTPAQLIVGTVLGYFLTAVQIYLLI
ncbi:phosphatase PAP2 family protein [Methanobacterium formicicum]|uniref:Phosphoesterase PA-phosphatase-like protein n=1 Tax=Methanobacterium formicicum (strain DSM 3637 / PP1) TaxID=1204725 RepID=K2R379_METFP|nr:phosphatase PAP2 family protein [Methanobacterium formicicum]EKF87008.1 phosphoesterase PA-phosphatase-like protein [Methanobacterium formicicum DSM 3637]